jgi:rare lipoprotein A
MMRRERHSFEVGADPPPAAAAHHDKWGDCMGFGEERRDAGRQARARAMRLGAAAAAAMLVANCGSQQTGRTIDPKYGVAASPRVVPDGEAIPKGGGRELVGKPYVVAGRTYVPTDSRGYVREGLASWYGTAFHGRLTANGEVFDRYSIAAAHPTMPLPSYARVTNLRNSRSMIVRVNDRGPYHGDRIMDVSERVAEALDFKRAGTARVRVEYVAKASVKGSDDEKLLATLREDGRPAPFPGMTAPVMVADRGGAAPRPLAFRAAEPGGGFAEQLAGRFPALTGRSERPLDLATIPDAATPVSARPLPVADLSPQRSVQAALFYAEPNLPRSRFTKDDPFKDLKPQRFVALKGQP